MMPELKNPTVVIVDDSGWSRTILRNLLEKNGFEYKNGIYVKKGPVRLGWYEKKKELIIGYHTMPIIVEFVHTLQHIIRLLGLEEDIVL